MFAFFAQLIDLACDEIKVEMAEIPEVEIENGFGHVWSVLFPVFKCEVFFQIAGNGQPYAYHTNWYD